MTLDIHRHPEAAAQRPSKDGRPQPGRRPPISGLPEIGTKARKSATADLRWLASRAPQGDGNESVLDAVVPGLLRRGRTSFCSFLAAQKADETSQVWFVRARARPRLRRAGLCRGASGKT